MNLLLASQGALEGKPRHGSQTGHRFRHRPDHSHFIALWVWGTFCLVCWPTLLNGQRLNVLLITSDDLGLQLSCYGDRCATTPSLDQFAEQSVRFRTAYVSQASCSPSRSTMLTGLYPHANGQYGLANASAEFKVHQRYWPRLLPNVLGEHGYRTGIIGKLHVNPVDEFRFDFRSARGFNQRDVRAQVELARRFFDADDSKPWFMMFNLFDPHAARDRTADGSRGPHYFPDRIQGLPKSLLTAAEVRAWPWQQIDDPSQLERIRGYYNCVHRMDVAVGWLLEALEDAGHRDNTLVIFVGDHGPPFTRGKTSCYEAGLRVPFLLRWPEVSSPHVSDRLVSTADIYPTVLDAAQISLPGPVHGRSLRAVADVDQTEKWRETLVAEFQFHGTRPFFPRRAITDGRYKLIHNLRAGEISALDQIDGDPAFLLSRSLPADHPARLAMDRLKHPPKWELYDLSRDPHEFVNRAGEPSLAEIQASLKQSLDAWQVETEDPFREKAFIRTVDRDINLRRR